MKENFFIKYRWLNEVKNWEISLTSLWESIIWFDLVIKELFKVSKIQWDISLSANKTREGSLIIDIVILIANNPDSIPFEKIGDLLDFLKIVDIKLYDWANNFFSEIWKKHRSINDYFVKNPFDLNILTLLFTGFTWYLIWKAKDNKKNPNVETLPKRYAIKLNKSIKKWIFKKALSPFVEWEISEIEISSRKDFLKKEVINKNNFWDYLNEKEEILSWYMNQREYMFTASVVSLQSTHWDSLKIRIHWFPKKYRDLVAYPEEWKTTKDYAQFYEENILVKAKILRDSMYQKPKLILINIKLQQEALFDEKNWS